VTFAAPAGLWLLALAIPVLLLHVLRPRRQKVEVSSTLLWDQVATPVSAAAPWQRLRPSLLLLLQLLAVALLALAAARPVRLVDAPLAEHTVFIVDASGSMAATDGDPDRLESAKARARELYDELPTGGVASVVVASDRPTVTLTASSDRSAFDDALAPVRVTEGRADFATAFSLAESLETPGTPIGFVLLSDGGLTDAEQGLLPLGTTYEPIGEASTNRAVVGLNAAARGSGLHVVATVANTGGGDAQQTLRIDVDGRTVSDPTVDVGSGEVVDVEVDVPAGDRIEAFLEGEDLLDADDLAHTAAPDRRDLRVFVAGPENPFLDVLLEALGGLEVERSETSAPATGYDLAIYDRVPVPPAPGAPFLAIAPPGGAPGVTVDGTVDRPVVSLVDVSDPLLEAVDLTEVAIASAQRVEAPTGTTLVAAEGAPLLVRGTLGGRPFLYLAFALADSNLPVQVAFPILGDRAITDLAGTALPTGDLVVGEALPVDAATGAILERPGGATIEVPPGAPAPIADRSGFWSVRAEGRPERLVAVNADPTESALAPATALLTERRQEIEGEQPPQSEVSLLPWLAWPLLVVLLLELLVARRRVGVPRRQWAFAVAVRVVVAALLVAALANLAVVRPAERVATVFLIDGSDSLGGDGRDAAVAWVREALDAQPRGALAGVALFGGDARLEATVRKELALDRPAVEIDPTQTDIATALRLAAAVLPTDARRRVVVVSDGRATTGEVGPEAARLAEAGIEVEHHLIGAVTGPDVAVSALDVAARAREGDQLTIEATVRASRAGPVQLALLRDGKLVDERVVDLEAGVNTVTFTDVATGSGLARYQLRATAAGDSVPQNDQAFAAVQIEGPATVLLVEGAPGNASTLTAALRAGGIRTERITPGEIPPLDRLTAYTSTVLVDVDARDLSTDQVRTISAATRDLGIGLVTIGGTHSYGVGGYLGSELEELLPVVSEILDPKRRQTVAQVLAVDTSGSMGACHCAEGSEMGGGTQLQGGVTKTDIARAAAARTIESLSAIDEVGVLAVDTSDRWLIDLQKLPSEEVVTSGLRKITPTENGTNLRTSLETSAKALRDSSAALKHIILFTDGFTDPANLEGLAEVAADLREEGITVSVLATGEGAADELGAIAEAGGGRFYPGRDLQQIPRIMQEEAVLASRSFITEGKFVPTVTGGSDATDGLDAAPPLFGYVATSDKGPARTLLRVGPDQDPLLATWQVGLGTATSWTSDASARWSQAWATWDGYVDFWTAVVRGSFPQGGSGGVLARIVDGVLEVEVESSDAFPDGSEASVRVTGPSLEGRDVRLERVAPDRFAGRLPIEGSGSFAVGAVVTAPDGVVVQGTAVASQSFSEEYEPGDADGSLLQSVSDATGGRGAIRPAQAFDSSDLRAGRSRTPLLGWLLLAAALLWPLAVALSRLALWGAVTQRLAYARSSLWYQVRTRVPSRPGQDAATVPRPERPVRPTPTEPSRRERRASEQAAARRPDGSLGSLLDSQRRRRGGATEAEPSDEDGG
jgi:Mg-chelatase subunit ChlD